MHSNDERREVAKRLRENATKRGVIPDYLGSTQVASWWLLLHTIGCESNKQEVAFNMLADLIDPVCHVVSTTSEDFLFGPTFYRHQLSCGHECDTGLPYPPEHCDVCGARVSDK